MDTEFDRLFKQFDKIFTPSSRTSLNTPNYSLWSDQSGNSYLSIDIPGVKKEDLQISLKDNLIHIKSIKPSRQYNYSFVYQYHLYDIDKDNLELLDGVLNIKFIPIPQERGLNQELKVK